VRWGDQLDIKPIATTTRIGDDEGQADVDGQIDPANSAAKLLSPEQVAGYIAKYVTKGTDTLGPGLDRRLTEAAVRYLPHRRVLRPHVIELIQTAWHLGDPAAYPSLKPLLLRKWAHQLGYGGHWTTRSRQYATTLTAIRTARAEHTRRSRWPDGIPRDAFGRPATQQAVEVVATWTWEGTGQLVTEHAVRAVQAATLARNHTTTGPERAA
jgi:hypothetical protein